MKTFLFNTMDFAQSWSAETLTESLHRDMRVLILPMMANDGWSADILAFHDELAESEKLSEPFMRCGIPLSHIRIEDPYDHDRDQMLRMMRGSDILCLVSDNAGYAMNVLEDLRLADTVKQFEGIVIGVGECVRILDRVWTSPGDGEENLGVGRYYGIGVYPNYVQSSEDLAAIIRYLELNETEMIVLDLEGGVLFTDEQIEIIGRAYIASEKDLDRLYMMYEDDLRL